VLGRDSGPSSQDSQAARQEALLHPDDPHNDIVYPAAIPFVLVHLAALGILWSGFSALSAALCLGLYFVRMWAITAGFHRYFSHRSYRTSRAFQFGLAFLGQLSAQRGVLWWAAIHRHHHRHSDTPLDVHSPKHAGFFFSHVGWIFSRQKGEADYSLVSDLAQFPELRWLDRHPYLPASLLAVGCFLLDGWTGLFGGFFLSTVLLYHGTFAINSVAHVVGRQRYVTGDESKNNWWLALITLGEGWHNNHHYYQSSTRQGFFWWEVDPSYYVLRILAWGGLVWDLRSPPTEVVRGERRLGRRVVERAAREMAERFSPDTLAAQIEAAWHQLSGLYEAVAALKRTRATAASHLRRKREDVLTHLRDLSLPDFPSVEAIRARLAQQYRDSPSLDEIAERAQEILLEKVLACLEPKWSLGTA